MNIIFLEVFCFHLIKYHVFFPKKFMFGLFFGEIICLENGWM